MMLTRAAALVAVLMTGTAMAGQNGIEARKPIRKAPSDALVRPEGATGRLIVKFADDAKVRVGTNNAIASRTQKDVRTAQAIIAQFGLTVKPAVTLAEDKAAALLSRAEDYSGKGQPDLLGLVYVTGPQSLVDRAAKMLNDLPEVEYVQFEPTYTTSFGGVGGCCIPVAGVTNCVNGVTQDICEGQGGLYQGDGVDCTGICDVLGACCVGEDECLTLSEDQCTGLGGIYQGDGLNCVQDAIDCAQDGCGDPALQDCFTEAMTPFCSDADCCTLVCTIQPSCCDEDAGEWDVNCVFLAQLVCETGDRCASGLAGNCFEAHPNPGCNNTNCCNAVCGVEPFCCENNWDDLCVELSAELCEVPGGGSTPNFTAGQGYLNESSYLQEGGVPAYMVPVIFGGGTPIENWGGEGYDLEGMELFADFITQQTGTNRAGQYIRGATIRVGIVEHSARLGHEELDNKVKKEPDQTILLGPGVLAGDHGTATLGIVGGRDHGNRGPNDEKGIIGIAPMAEMWFFPIVSAEEGGRLINAVTSAINTFGPGDILSFSIGPGGCGNLASGQTEWLLLNLATASGITCFISAGNDCCNLEDNPQFDDTESGAVVVGACFPGAPFCRLGFSNHCETCEGGSNVHCSAWGTAVTTIGYGDLFIGGGDPKRAYTNSFGGTSAAAPIVAGIAARLQGFAKLFYGVPLTPAQIMALVSNPGDTLYNQCRVPNPEDLPGVVDVSNCLGDFDPEEEPNRIGPTVNALGSAVGIVTGQYFDSNPFIEFFTVVRGEHISGNTFSITSDDGNFVVVKSLYTQRTHHPNYSGPLGEVLYTATGQITDLVVEATSQVPTPGDMVISTSTQFPPVNSLMFVELYDWYQNRWSFVDLQTGTGDLAFQHLTTNPARFVQPGSSRILVRLWTLALGASGGGPGGGIGFGGARGFQPAPQTWRFDMVNVAAQ